MISSELSRFILIRFMLLNCINLQNYKIALFQLTSGEIENKK